MRSAGSWQSFAWLMTLTLGASVVFTACGDDGSGASSDETGGGEAGAPGVGGGSGGTGGSGGSGASGGDGQGGAPGPENSAGNGTGGKPGDPVGDFFASLERWQQPAEASEEKSPPATERRSLKTASGPKWPFDCEVVTHDIVEKHDEILNFDSGAAYVKPGVLLVGSEFLKGKLAPIPLRRAPITLSINVPGVDTATVKVEDPNLANIQQGIADLQAQAQAAAEGSYAAQLSYEQHTVQSTQEMAVKLGVSAGFDGLFASANFSAKFEDEETVEKYTVASKLMQQMYTISFAQDEFRTARDFFAPDLAIDELNGAQNDGFLGMSNPPVFIGSVTYGRMVVFTATSNRANSRQSLQSTLQASGSNWSASAELSLEQKEFLASLDIEVLSIGGNQAQVTNAIKTGDWSDLYAGADILSSVPLRYTVHSLTGTRPIASIGDTTSFTTSDCAAIEGWYEHPTPADVSFSDVSTNPTNDPVMLIGRRNGTYAPYRVTDDGVTQVPGFSKTAALEIAVDDVGNTYVYDPDGLAFSQLPLNGNAWNSYAGASNFGCLSFDAGGNGFLVALSATYPDNENDLYKITWGSPRTYWFDNAQSIKKNNAPWFAVTGTGYVGRNGNELGFRANDGGWTQLTTDPDMETIERITAVTSNEIYALRKGTGQVVRFNAATKKFDSPIDPPAGKMMDFIEATSNKRLWGITEDFKLYAYSPPR